MGWDELRYFLEAARAGSFLGAAQQLGCTHGTVSRRVGRLEARLETRLFERGQAGLTLTAAGEEVLELAERAEGVFFELERCARGRDMRLQGEVRVAVPDLLARMLSGALAGFSRAHPGVVIELVTGTAMHDLTRREADVALRVAAQSPPGHLVGRRLARVAYAGYAAGVGTGARAPERWLAWGSAPAQQAMARWLRGVAPGARVVMSVDAGLVVLAMARAGAGAALLPVVVGRAEADLVEVAPRDPALDMTLWALTHADLRKTARIRALLDHLARVIPDLGLDGGAG